MTASEMNKFQVLRQATNCAARSGIFCTKSGAQIKTPMFLCPTSRGVVPHLTPDNVSRVRHGGGIYLAAEDFMDKIESGRIPLMNETEGTTLRELMCLKDSEPIIIGPRRSSPAEVSQPNTDQNLSISTSEGVKKMPIETYYKFVTKMKPDVVLAAPDIPHLSPGGLPGSNRARKMVLRSEKWLDGALELGKKEGIDVFAVMVPGVATTVQREYIEFLKQRQDSISGLTFWNSQDTPNLDPKKKIEPILSLVANEFGLDHLPKLLAVDVVTPQEVLNLVAKGFDMFQGDMVTQFTDIGIALDIKFPPVGDSTPAVWGRNMWDLKYETDMSLLAETALNGTQYYRAYVHHLLKAREMSAWVILQLHNMSVIDKFFEDVRASIDNDTFAQYAQLFETRYGTSQQLEHELAEFRKVNVGPTTRSTPNYRRF